MKQTITPLVPTFYSFQGELHRVTAWILDDSKDQDVLDAVNELGWLEEFDDKNFRTCVTNPITPIVMEDILENFFENYSEIDLKDFAYYKKAVALGADLSLVASNEQEFMEFALKVANK